MELSVVLLGVFIRLVGMLLAPYFWMRGRRPARKVTPPAGLLLRSVTDLAAGIRDGELSSERVVSAFISRVRDVNPLLNAVVEERFQEAIADARAADRLIEEARASGTIEELFKAKPLLGVPFTVKESLSLAAVHLDDPEASPVDTRAPSEESHLDGGTENMHLVEAEVHAPLEASAGTTAAEASTSALPADVAEVELDNDTLGLLGEAPEPETMLGKAIHKDVAARWLDIVKKGLTNEAKEKLAKDYLIPSNCELLIPPILNAEAKAALTDALVKRDSSLVYRQKQIGNALAALAQVIDVAISKDCDQNLRHKLLKPASDACRIMCDMHYNETKIRKRFVITSVNSSLKDTLVRASTDKYLFGEDMSEKIKTAKNVQRSGEALKVTSKVTKPTFTRPFNRLNYRPLHQKMAGKQDAGKNQPATRQQSNRAAQPRRGRALPPQRSPPPSPPRRQNNRR